MRARTGLLLLLIVPFAAYAQHPLPVDPTLPETMLVFRSARPSAPDLRAFDLVQHTCALFVTVRSGAWENAVAFGDEMDDSTVHWNMCPGGTMVACALPPGAKSDAVPMGIPWPYQVEKPVKAHPAYIGR